MSDYLPDDYTSVHERIKKFREDYPQGEIATKIVKWEDGLGVFRAKVTDEDDNVLGQGTGHATREDDKFVGEKFYEKGETVAVGRALAFAGYGIEHSIASQEEVASVKQNKPKPNRPKPNTKPDGDLTLDDIKQAIKDKEGEWSDSAFADDPTEGQINKFNIFWSDNIEGNENNRYRFLSEVTGRNIESSKDLLKGEISALIEIAMNNKAGFVDMANKFVAEGTEEMFE